MDGPRKFAKVPNRLKWRKQWVAYRLPNKIPFNPLTNKPASSTDPATWVTFEEATEHATNGTGVGYVFAFDDKLLGIDLDGCRNPTTNDIAPWAREIIKAVNSYAEVSPSETGVKIWCESSNPFDRGRKFELGHVPRLADKQPAVELYDRERYFCVTGKRLSGFDQIRKIAPEKIRAILTDAGIDVEPTRHSHRMPEMSDHELCERARKYVAAIPPAISGQGGDKQTFCVACALVLGFCLTPDQALPLMVEYSERCQPPWTDRELLHKLKSANQQSGERGYLRDKQYAEADVRSFGERYAERKPDEAPRKPARFENLFEETKRYLATLGDSTADALYSTGLRELDHALSGGLGQQEMVIIAGRPGHGKSALGMQLVYAIAEHAACLVISEEMNTAALCKRSVQFATDTGEAYWARHRSTVQADVAEHFARRHPILVVRDIQTAANAFHIAKQAKTEYQIGCVMIDYAQLLASGGNGRYEQVTKTSIELARIAREHELLTIVLCQCNRQLEGRSTIIPNTSDLRDSGQLEQDADVIIFGVWPVRIQPNYKPPSEYILNIAKSRNREIRQQVVKCTFEASRMRVVGSSDVFGDPQDNPFDEALR